jgi:hypothetical protein
MEKPDWCHVAMALPTAWRGGTVKRQCQGFQRVLLVWTKAFLH